MASNRAPLTEDELRERVNLWHQHLADVRSLSLPGTYHEKISHLGNALKNFTRLKSLDLSRNALTTLEGLQHLTCLEKLNLYFNHISSLSEVFRLHSLTALKDVDLRLNPVVKNESDYRLFVIHMLPNLRRLDDRPVRDSERRAALLHFSTDTACKFKTPSIVTKEAETEGSVHPRVEYINSMSKKCLEMDEDDEVVLNLIAKCEWDLKKPPGITGSAKVDPKVELYSLNSICKIEDNTKQHLKSEGVSPRLILLQKWKKENLPKGSPIQNKIVWKATEIDKAPPRTKEPVVSSWTTTESDWKRPEQTKLYSKISMPQGSNQVTTKVLYEASPMEDLLDLVDKHWNGSKSLHCNEAFLSQAKPVLTAMQKSVPTDQQKHFSEQQELNNVILEKKALEKHLSEQAEEYNSKIKSLTSDLNNTKKEMDVLKRQLNKLLEENTALKEPKPNLQQNVQDIADSASSQIKKLENQNKLLTDENVNLKQRLQHLDKMQELTEMLQGSHRTLVSTNERLLKELDELRSQHKTEVEQLQWNYNQLKKTVDTVSPDNKKNNPS